MKKIEGAHWHFKNSGSHFVKMWRKAEPAIWNSTKDAFRENPVTYYRRQGNADEKNAEVGTDWVPHMAGFGSQDLVSELQVQLDYFRDRVEVKP